MEIKSIKPHFIIKKWVVLTIMRTFIFLLCATVFGFNTEITKAQQKVIIDEDRIVTIDAVFNLIIDQTEYSFLYPTNLFENEPKVKLSKGKISVGKLLNTILPSSKFNILIENDNRIIIKSKPKIQQMQVSGKVISEFGEPLVGVAVLLKGTLKATTTNFDGEFSIMVKELQNVLNFSYLGFETQEVIVIGNQSEVNVILKEKTEALNEIVVTGYQKISKERSTGSVIKPEIGTVKNRTTSRNVLQLIDGLVPGLFINNAPNTADNQGNPVTGSINIRGKSTLNADTGILFVVDGIILNDISSINAQDVKDITVLKDATATSIYGARASNGVIVIRTKSGSFNQKLTFDFDSYINVTGRPDINYFPVLDSQKYIETVKELFNPTVFPYSRYATYNPAFARTPIPKHEQVLYDLDNGLINQFTADAILNEFASTNNTKQIRDLFYRNSFVQNHVFSAQGGSNKHSFYASLAYNDTQSNTPGEEDKTIKLNLSQNFKIGKRIDVSLRSDLSNRMTKAGRVRQLDNRFVPYEMFRDENGVNLSVNSLGLFSRDQLNNLENTTGLNLDYVPLDEFNNGYTEGNNLNARITSNISVDLFKGLKYQGTFGYNWQNGEIEKFDSQDSYKIRSLHPFFTISGNTPTFILPTTGGEYSRNNINQKNWTIRNQLTYTNSDNNTKHVISALAGYEVQNASGISNTSSVLGYNLRTLNVPLLDYNTLTANITRDVLVSNVLFSNGSRLRFSPYSSSESLSRFVSIYANGSYTYNNKYTITASIRGDKSNLFGIDKSAQNRPVWSTGVKWNVANENFMYNLNWLNNLYIRATYGITGNSPSPGQSSTFDIFSPSFFTERAFNSPEALNLFAPGNKILTWERTKNLNLGIDYAIFNNRLNGSFDYYIRKTDNLLGEIPSNVFTGFSSIQGNQGSIENKGFEVSLQSINLKGKLGWNSRLTLGYNLNKITELNQKNEVKGGDLVGGFTRFIKGYSAFPLFAYDFVGLNNEGDPQIRLADGSIVSDPTNLDLGVNDVKYMGTYQPVWSGGFSNSFTYGGFNLAANIVYNLGHVMLLDRPTQFDGNITNSNTNKHSYFYNRWRNPGDENFTNVPRYLPNRVSTRSAFFYTRGDINVASASYIKLRDISLSYSLPNDITRKIGASQITFRSMLNNIMLWKENKEGIDPEFHDASRGVRYLPVNQNSFSFGLHLTF